jgi:hypothetical protein
VHSTNHCGLKRFENNFHLYWTYADIFLVIISETIFYKNYLHSIYVILDIISNLGMIYSIQQDTGGLYADGMHLIKTLKNLRDFAVLGGWSWNEFLCR